MTAPDAHARWIIVTPSTADEAWRSAIRSGVAEAALTVIPHDPDIPAAVLDDPKVVIYAQDATTALAAGAKTITAILPDPHTSVAAVEAAFQTPRPTSIVNATHLLAAAAALAVEHQVYGPNQLASLKGPLQVFPDLAIIPPPPEPVASGDDLLAGVGDALAIYQDGRPVIGAPSVSWPLDALYYESRIARASDGVREIDLTGRPRILVYGPYIALPPGLWRAKIRFSVNDASAAGREYRIDWGTQTDFVSQTFTPGRSGIFELELDYLWTSIAPAEVRFLIMEGCFSGSASFIGVEVSLVRAAEPKALRALPTTSDGQKAVS